MRPAAIGAALVVAYTGLIASADAITKFIAGGYAAPQLFCLAGLIVVGLTLAADRHPSQRRGLRTTCPRAMAVRAVSTVLAALSFFYAFRHLPFAEVFLFIGLMPILAGLMSGPILGERVRPAVWGALLAGLVGVMCLFPTGWHGVTIGHAFAFAAASFGTLSIVMSRYIGKYENNSLAQLFYPNLAIFVSMGVALPFVWTPMALSDLAWVAAYGAVLFVARWVLVLALRSLSAFAVTPLMNLQFVWMVALGMLVFGEIPSSGMILGVAIVIGSGVFLVWDQLAPAPSRRPLLPVPARVYKTDP